MGVILDIQAEWAGEWEKGRGITWPSCGMLGSLLWGGGQER